MSVRSGSGVWLLATLGLATTACDLPSPSIHIRFSAGPTQACPSLDCSRLPAMCDSVMSIRIVDPAQPSAPYHRQCTPLGVPGDLCRIGGVDLEVTRPLPVQELEVQISIFPRHALDTDEEGAPICPPDVQYGFADGFPVSGSVMPALGGRSFYRPGDETIVVELGCTNLDALNPPACEGTFQRNVRAMVDDFDRASSVFLHEASRLSLHVGSPVAEVDDEYALNVPGLPMLVRADPASNVPAWSGTISAELSGVGCVAVSEDVAGNTTTVTCRSIDLASDYLDFTGRHAGARLTKSSLDQILRTMGLSEFPTKGITIGVVLDADGHPVSGQVVTATEGTVRYLSSDRRFLVGSATTGGPQGGVFVSLDAPFNTRFSTTSRTLPNETVSAIGGRIRDKVTIVVLRFTGPVVEPG
jgi:hypothetical protein